MEKVIDLAADYGVVYGKMGNNGKPPYSPQEYIQANANRLAIQQAFDDAFAEGYREVSTTDAFVTINYTYTNEDSFAANQGDISIWVRKGHYKLWGLTLDVMFDSDVKSPYHTTSKRPLPYQLVGRVFGVENGKDTIIEGVTMLGDVYKRSWSNSNEKAIEQSTGIYVKNNVFDLKLIGCKLRGFMGDGSSGGQGYGLVSNKLTDGTFRDFVKGLYVPSTKTLNTTVPGAYVTEVQNINETALNDPDHFNRFLAQVRITDGSNKVMRYPAEQNLLIWLDANENQVGESFVFSAEPVYIPYNAKKVRFQIYNVLSEEPTYQYSAPLYPPALVALRTRKISYQDCEFTDGHRGGLSNIDDDGTIDNCDFINNGLDSSVGAPLFPDTTRYQIDIENVFSSKIAVTNNRFMNSFNGVLLSSYNAVVFNNTFNNSGGVTIYGRCLNADVSYNKIYGFGILNILEFNNDASSTGNRRRIHMHHNTSVVDGEMCRILSLYLNETDLIFDHNDLTGNTFDLSGHPNGELDISHNVFTLRNNVKSSTATVQGSVIKDVKNFNYNTIKRLNPGLPQLNYRLYLDGTIEGKGNIFKNLNIYKSGYTYGNTINRYISGIKFDNCSFQNNTSIDSNLIISEYKDCEFINYVPYITESSQATFQIIERYINCTFIFDNEVQTAVIKAQGTATYIVGQERTIILESCKVISKQTTQLSLIGVSGSTSGSPRRMYVRVIDLEVTGADGLENRMFTGGGELKS